MLVLSRYLAASALSDNDKNMKDVINTYGEAVIGMCAVVVAMTMIGMSMSVIHYQEYPHNMLQYNSQYTGLSLLHQKLIIGGVYYMNHIIDEYAGVIIGLIVSYSMINIFGNIFTGVIRI